jgi:predicted lipoprotein with Yx(FWY)xxD motif
MRHVLGSLTAAAFVITLGAPAFAATATVTGKVMDEGCSLEAKNGQAMHHEMQDMTECAIMCAKNGEPLALITSDGKVYRITGGLAANKNAKLIAYVGHTVEITGDVSEKDGKVQIAADALKMVSK